MSLKFSKIYEGRISREELQYHLPIPHLKDEGIESLSLPELKVKNFEILESIKQLLYRTDYVASRWKNYGLGSSNIDYSDGHGASNNLILQESRLAGKQFTGQSTVTAKNELDDPVNYMKFYSNEKKKIVLELNNLIEYSKVVLNQDENEIDLPSVFTGIEKLTIFIDLLMDFILLTLPGRTFLNSM
jgi:hypothetical protein